MRILFVSWRDLANPQAGGSEVVVDRLAEGMQQRGHEVALVSGGPTAPRAYPVVDAGGTYAQYLRAPMVYLRRFRDYDLVVDVENGVPFFIPLFRRRPVVCFVHHVHVEQWRLYFSAPVAWLGRFLERRVMPVAYRKRVFVAVSRSTAQALESIGIAPDRIRTIEMGSAPVSTTAQRSPTPLFLAVGRLVHHKRIGLLLEMWERVRPTTGGRLVIVGEGPEDAELRRRAGNDVEFTGYLPDAEKRHLLGEAWILVHPAQHEGWGTVIMEAAAAGTPTVGFDVPGVHDSVVDGVSGVLAQDTSGFEAGWVRLAGDEGVRERLSAGARQRAGELTWDRALDRFAAVVAEAVPG